MKQKITPIQCRDTAMALVFLFMLIWYFTASKIYAYVAMVVLLLAMIWPGSMAYPARIWFGLSHALGGIMNKVILGLLFFLLVVPIAVVRKLMGKDPMQLKQWKNGTGSLFVVREHKFVKEDLDNAF